MDKPDPRPGFYYVSAIDGPRSARVRGPFTTHVEALALVDSARDALVALVPYAHFYAFGTCRAEVNLGPGYLDALATEPTPQPKKRAARARKAT